MTKVFRLFLIQIVINSLSTARAYILKSNKLLCICSFGIGVRSSNFSPNRCGLSPLVHESKYLCQANMISQQNGEEKDNSGEQKDNVESLLWNLDSVLEKWILTGAPTHRASANTILREIQRDSDSEDTIKRATRMFTRAGMPMDTSSVAIDGEKNRNEEVEVRKQWESSKEAQWKYKKVEMNQSKKPSFTITKLSRQETKEHKEHDDNAAPHHQKSPEELYQLAATKQAKIIANVGSGSAFKGEVIGVGGLDGVLDEIKRRIWIPLAAPPSILEDLGINTVKGLLLYGKPGCGKTLLARTIGTLLSPMRPLTIVSGPEIMEKYVGSSEANLRRILDEPPEIYPQFLSNDAKFDKIMERTATHVIVFDEFDAIARARGGQGGKGDQGDAGIARDSVVNQILAKIDGVEGLCVPTLLVALTNRRELLDPALLRAGRFEVQIEVPPPNSVEQRISIFRIHMNKMFESGRLLVSDAPSKNWIKKPVDKDSPCFVELLHFLAVESDGMTGASIAGICRAAASRALERSVLKFSESKFDEMESIDETQTMFDCLVTKKDFELAFADIRGSDPNAIEDVS